MRRIVLCSVRAESDVVVYAFPQDDFDACVMKYPSAAQYVAAEGRVTADYQPTGEQRAPQQTFLHNLVGARPPETCRPETSIREAARQILSTSSDALAVVDAAKRIRGVVTVDALLQLVADGTGDVDQPVEQIVAGPPTIVAPDTSVADAVLAMEGAHVSAVAITSNAAADGGLQAIVTAADLGQLFGEQPSTIVRGIRAARTTAELRALNRRARAFTLEHLTEAAAVEWLAKLAHMVDVAIVTSRARARRAGARRRVLVHDRRRWPRRIADRRRTAARGDRGRRCRMRSGQPGLSTRLGPAARV
jgi:CBS domain-containing protein